jgi:exonuclease VII small subunit
MQVSNSLKNPEILDYGINQKSPSSDYPLSGRCQLNWEDYAMISIIAVTICFLIAAIIIAQYTFVAGLSISVIGLVFGECYIFNYADYYKLKEQIKELDSLSKDLIETEKLLKGQVKSLEQEIETIQQENLSFATSNEIYKKQNQELEERSKTLAQTNVELQKTAEDLRDLAEKGFPNALASYNDLMNKLETQRTKQDELIISEVQLVERINAATTELQTIRQSIQNETMRLTQVAKQLEANSKLYPQLETIVADLRKIVYHDGANTDTED